MKPTEVCHQDICAQMSQLVSFQMQISQKLSIGKKCVPVALALNIADIYGTQIFMHRRFGGIVLCGKLQSYLVPINL